MKYSTGMVARILKHKWLYIMALPGIIYFIIFKYIPMFGLIIAFQDYSPFRKGADVIWVGFKHFIRLFSEPTLAKLFSNTLIISIYNLIFFFPLPIILALLLNEVRKMYFKRIVQTLTYVPHFLSFVTIVSITYIFFTTEGGIVNEIIDSLGGEKIPFLLSEKWLRPFLVGQVIWKESGWGTIIFLAAITGIDMSMYESAAIDGASRWRQAWHITLPCIRSTIVILLILRMGSMMDTGFEQIYNMVNALNRSVGEVFDTYVYEKGIGLGEFSYTAVVGMFKSVVSLILVLTSNYLSRKFGEEGVI